MSIPLVIYHSPCNDGWCAAWILSRCFDQVELHPANYGDDPPVVDGRTVMVVDFSYPREVMEQMNEDAHRMIVLDHHKSAKENCAGLPFCIFDESKSGAGLVYQWCREKGYLLNIKDRSVESGMDNIVRYVQDRDLWKHKLPFTHEINAALRSYDWDLATWDTLARQVANNLNTLRYEGEAILRYKKQLVAPHVGHCTDRYVAGYLVPSVQCTAGDLISDVLSEICKGKPFAMSYCLDSEGFYRCSLRSDSENPDSRDVSKIASQFGGGGHKHAAGFRVKSGAGVPVAFDHEHGVLLEQLVA